MFAVSPSSHQIPLPKQGRLPGLNAVAQDAAQYSGKVPMGNPAAPKAPGKTFWAAVSKAAWGGKKASWFRKAIGWFAFPFVLGWKGLLWLVGYRKGFKDLHPLQNQSQQEIYKAIQALDKQIEPLADARLKKQNLKPEDSTPVQFGFSWEEVQKADLPKNQLLKLYDSRKGLLALLKANDWPSTAKALEQFLAANGKNRNNQSCMNISWTHAQTLSNLAPIKRKSFKQAEIYLHPEWKKILDSTQTPFTDKMGNTLFRRDAKPQGAPFLNAGSTGASAQELKEAAQIYEEEAKLAKRYGMAAPALPMNADSVKNKLLAEGSGAQALLFDIVGPEGSETGHVTLLVNIGGQLYHIDNFADKSAKVSTFEAWLTQKQPNALFLGPLKNKIHPAIANG